MKADLRIFCVHHTVLNNSADKQQATMIMLVDAPDLSVAAR